MASEMERVDSAQGAKGCAYITLITRPSYLAGVILLAHTLRTRGSKHPLIVLYTSTLGGEALEALRCEEIVLEECELLFPAEHHELHVAVKRFQDTWTKLRVFDSAHFGFESLCYLDADMMILNNMDTIFDSADSLKYNEIAAVHDCVCSPTKHEWTPADYCPENCALTPQEHPTALEGSIPVTESSRPTYHLFNSGMFLFRPSEKLYKEIINFFDTTDLLGTFRFPDQQLMTHFFHGRFKSVSGKYNAVKTMAYRHTNIWSAEDVVCLHYIVDKPWAERVDRNGVAGFSGQDGETHQWWWDEYDAWVLAHPGKENLAIVAKHVAGDNPIEGLDALAAKKVHSK